MAIQDDVRDLKGAVWGNGKPGLVTRISVMDARISTAEKAIENLERTRFSEGDKRSLFLFNVVSGGIVALIYVLGTPIAEAVFHKFGGK